MNAHLVSVVSPVYNEEAVIRDFVARLTAIFRSLDDEYGFEAILVNDGSQDYTNEMLKELKEYIPRSELSTTPPIRAMEAPSEAVLLQQGRSGSFTLMVMPNITLLSL